MKLSLALVAMLAMLSAGCGLIGQSVGCDDPGAAFRLQKEHVIPRLPEDDIARVQEVDDCDSGDGPYLAVELHGDYDAESIIDMFPSSDWRRLELEGASTPFAQQAGASTVVDGRNLVVVAEWRSAVDKVTVTASFED